jgi:predicted nucleotidyltransferase
MHQKETIAELKLQLQRRFPGLIRRVILFGSQIIGNYHDNSDYDVLIVTGYPVDWQLDDQISQVCYEVMLEHDIFIDYKTIAESELASIKGRQPFILDAIETGVTV